MYHNYNEEKMIGVTAGANLVGDLLALLRAEAEAGVDHHLMVIIIDKTPYQVGIEEGNPSRDKKIKFQKT